MILNLCQLMLRDLNNHNVFALESTLALETLILILLEDIKLHGSSSPHVAFLLFLLLEKDI